MKEQRGKKEIPIKDKPSSKPGEKEHHDTDNKSDGGVIGGSTAAKVYKDQAGSDEPKKEGDAGSSAEKETKHEETIKSLEKRLAELNDKYLRLHAEFDNFRKRNERERRNLIARAGSSIVSDLLPILDNFRLALGYDASSDESFRSGMELIHKQLHEALGKHGLEHIPSVGEVFDPMVHEALMTEPSAEYEEGIVIEELQSGYKLNGTVLRPARVKVSSGPPTGTISEPGEEEN
jgi:molecular chaperone GrpE